MAKKLKETDGHADMQTSKVVLSAAFCSTKNSLRTAYKCKKITTDEDDYEI